MIDVIEAPQHWEKGKYTIEIANPGGFALLRDGKPIATSKSARGLSAWALERGAPIVRWEGEALLRWETLDRSK